MKRIAACVAGENITEYATSWAARMQWRLAASPGWDAAYASALAAGVKDPGGDPGVITDGQILAAVQALLMEVTPSHLPEEPAE